MRLLRVHKGRGKHIWSAACRDTFNLLVRKGSRIRVMALWFFALATGEICPADMAFFDRQQRAAIKIPKMIVITGLASVGW